MISGKCGAPGAAVDNHGPRTEDKGLKYRQMNQLAGFFLARDFSTFFYGFLRGKNVPASV